MAKNSGYICITTDTERYGVVYHAEQREAFQKLNKVFIHYYKDRLCTEPLLDEKGKQIS